MQIGHVCQHVPGKEERGRPLFFAQASGGVGIEEFHERGNAGFDGARRDIGGRLNSLNAQAQCLEALQDGAIVAGSFHDEVTGIQAIAAAERLRQPAGMAAHGIGSAGNVDVVRK